jgi:hypothetical protein
MVFKKKKVTEVQEVKEVKTSYPKALDEIEFDIKLGVTHSANEANTQYHLGEVSMLEKVKKALS